MRKSVLLMILLFAVGMTASAQKFALIDMEYILKNIPAYERANEQLNQVSKKWQSEVEKVAEEYEPDHLARRKAYLFTNSLSLRY